ncbi:hypothetical protein AVEN_94558-1 [Araneus ventricosus]|uniref:Uncharacterized protein n=1 Tax=Araneus ventricosus TaxID=182803 RepID=A0A4Y2VDE2_ARAVE|nr:hypothetical protein AVEN_94558-1 [Araneus ventricosus]
MVIGTVDMLSTNKITGTLRRKMMRQKSKFQPQKGTTEKLNVLISSESSQSHSDDIFQTQSQASTSADPCLLHFTFKNALQIRSFRQGWTVIATVVLHALTSEIDKIKLRRKHKIARKLVAEDDKVLQIPSLYIDGRKNKTLIIS